MPNTVSRGRRSPPPHPDTSLLRDVEVELQPEEKNRWLRTLGRQNQQVQLTTTEKSTVQSVTSLQLQVNQQPKTRPSSLARGLSFSQDNLATMGGIPSQYILEGTQSPPMTHRIDEEIPDSKDPPTDLALIELGVSQKPGGQESERVASDLMDRTGSPKGTTRPKKLSAPGRDDDERSFLAGTTRQPDNDGNGSDGTEGSAQAKDGKIEEQGRKLRRVGECLSRVWRKWSFQTHTQIST